MVLVALDGVSGLRYNNESLMGTTAKAAECLFKAILLLKKG